MIILTNSASQEVAPGQSLIFDTEILKTGCAECHRTGSGTVMLRMRKAIYEIKFSANIGATAPGAAQVAIDINGDPLSETTMISTTAAAGNVNNVSSDTAVRTCCFGTETVTIENLGETTIVVENPLWFIKRIA